MVSVPATFGLKVLLDWTLIILGPVPDDTDDNGSAVLFFSKSSSEFYLEFFSPTLTGVLTILDLLGLVFLRGTFYLAWKLNLEIGIEAETGSADFLVNSLSTSLMSLFFYSLFSYFYSAVFLEAWTLPFTVL